MKGLAARRVVKAGWRGPQGSTPKHTLPAKGWRAQLLALAALSAVPTRQIAPPRRAAPRRAPPRPAPPRPATLTPTNAADTQALRRRQWAQALLWIVPLAWSSNYLIARAAAGVISPHTLALGRWSLAFALMLPLAWRALARQQAPWLREEWRQFLLLGGLGMWICGAFVYIGGQTTSSANIALIYAATSIAIAVVGAVLLHERMTPVQILGVALALLGVLFVIAKGEPRNLLAVRFTAGDGWIPAAACSWTAYSVLLRRWPSKLDTVARLVAITEIGRAHV